jgi:hypothetical protein
VDIVVAALDSAPSAVPEFTTLSASKASNKNESDTAQEKKRLDTAVEILDSGFYETSTKTGYSEIPEIVNGLTEEEAQNILKTLPVGGESSSSAETGSSAT